MTEETPDIQPDVDPVSIEDELGAIFDEANADETEDSDGRARGPDGKFIAKEDAPEAEAAPEGDTEITDQSAEPEPEAEPVQALTVPASWSVAEQAIWPGMSPEAQEIALRREADWQTADGERATKLKGYEPIAAALEPVQQHLALNGMDEATFVRRLVTADRYLRESPQEAIRWIASQYGADLTQIMGAESELDPSLAPIVQEMNQLKSQLTGFQTQQQQDQDARVNGELEAFAKDHPHFEAVRTHMGALMSAGSAGDMQTAYDMAVWGDPTTRASIQAESSVAAEQKRKEEATAKAKTAKIVADTNLSTKGTAPGQAPKQYDSREAELGDIYDRAVGAT